MVEPAAVDVPDALVVRPLVAAKPAKGLLVQDFDDEVALMFPIVHLLAGEPVHDGIGGLRPKTTSAQISRGMADSWSIVVDCVVGALRMRSVVLQNISTGEAIFY